LLWWKEHCGVVHQLWTTSFWKTAITPGGLFGVCQYAKYELADAGLQKQAGQPQSAAGTG
jgi:hypothetical protein